MLDLSWSDAVSTLQSLQNYLIAIGVILALAVIATAARLKLAKHQKFMIRCQTWIAALLAIVVVVNIICTGPMFTLLSLISGSGTLPEPPADTYSDELLNNAKKFSDTALAVSLGRIPNGTVNPSGKAADTFARDFTQAPVGTTSA